MQHERGQHERGQHEHGRGWARWGAAAGLSALLALTGAPGSEAAPPQGPTPGAVLRGEGSRDRLGEAEEGGPRVGAVDRRYSTPAAARRTVHDEHARHRHGSPDAGTSGTGTAAAATPAAGEVVLDPAVFGSWRRTSYPLPVRAIHATLLRTGKVLLIAGSGNQSSVFEAGTFRAGLLDPSTGAYQPVDPPHDMFCAGHAQLPNGNVLVVGGTRAYPSSTAGWKGSAKVYEFDVATARWIARPSMAHGRWYPSSVQAPSGHVWNFAGTDEAGRRNTRVERYTTTTGALVAKPSWSLPQYPGLLWTAKDRVLYAGTRSSGASGQPGLYHPGTGAVQAVTGITQLSQRRAAATVLAGDATTQRVLVLGGGWPATSSTSVVDLRPATPVGVAGPALATAKAYVGAVNLPTDGSVFQTGGGTGRDTPVFESSVVRGSTVSSMAPNTVPRTYHSSTLLLPDGRVLTLGGDDAGEGFEMQVEVFSPPYLHRGSRPIVTAAPSRMVPGTAYTVTATAAGSTPVSAWLVRPSSTTHAVDPNQRAVRLPATRIAGGLRVTTPSRFLTPPGYHMLFVNDSLGRPSVARWVRVG